MTGIDCMWFQRDANTLSDRNIQIIEDMRSSSTDNEPKDPSDIPSSIAVTDSCAIFSFNLFSNGVVPLYI